MFIDYELYDLTSTEPVDAHTVPPLNLHSEVGSSDLTALLSTDNAPQDVYPGLSIFDTSETGSTGQREPVASEQPTFHNDDAESRSPNNSDITNLLQQEPLIPLDHDDFSSGYTSFEMVEADVAPHVANNVLMGQPDERGVAGNRGFDRLGFAKPPVNELSSSTLTHSDSFFDTNYYFSPTIDTFASPVLTSQSPPQALPGGRALTNTTRIAAEVTQNRHRSIFTDKCEPWCSCSCHKSSSVHSPFSARRTFGALNIKSKGFFRRSGTCDQLRCGRRASPSWNFSYRFPMALWQRKLHMSYSYSMWAGPKLSVSLPRVVNWTSPVWQQATKGNTNAVMDLFNKGQAHPQNISPVGGNLVLYAMDHWNLELGKLLVNEYDLDAEAEDDNLSSGIAVAWEKVLSGRISHTEADVVANLFRKYDYLESQGFSQIHKAVLGLIGRGLDDDLLNSRLEINLKDAQGRTALCWACIRGDEKAVIKLLENSADPAIADRYENTPLHYVQNVACASVLLKHHANIGALNREGQTPLYTACRNTTDPVLVQFLLKNGSDINKADHSDQTPLCAATGNGRTKQTIFVLLDGNADINARNNSGDTPLVFSVVYNMHRVLERMLRDGKADFSIVNNYGQSFAHMIARMADLETVEMLTTAMVAGSCAAPLKLDLAKEDKSGKTYMDYFKLRMYENNDAGGELLRGFEKLAAAIGRVEEVA